MLWLRTLGAVYVAHEAGSPLGGAAGQRRLLALLSMLAVAGDGGLRRDRILALLWPDRELEKARHALTQTLYHARRTFQCDDLFFAETDIRLNFSRMSSDVRDLEMALRAGDWEQAAQLFGGAFLEGLVLPGSIEFEQWSSAQRVQIAARMTSAYEQLASGAERAGDLSRAIEWRKRALALDPVSSSVTVKLLETLAAAGDRSGALHHARLHELLVREQLELEPDVAVRTFVDRMRAEAASDVTTANDSASDQLSPNATPASRDEFSLPIPLSSTAAPQGATEGDVAPPQPSTGRDPISRAHRWRHSRTIGAGLLLSIAGLAVGRFLHGNVTASAAPLQQALVVAPFRVSGADASLGFLSEGLVELLTVRLAEDSSARAVDPGAVLSAWRSARLPDKGRLPRDRALAVARQLGASRVVVGSVVGNAARIVITASLIGAAADSLHAQASVDGPSDSLTTLVSRLASKLIAASAGETDRFTDRTTPSPTALRAYLEGQSAYRRGDFSLAIPFYERALELDSTFALAALHLALAADQINDAEQHDRALALAWANRGDLIEQDLVHLIAFAGPRYPAPSSEAEQLAAWERAVSRSPDRAEVWNELGLRFFHQGAVLGLRDGNQRAAAAFRRALALDPSYLPSRRFLVMVTARLGDTTALRRLATPNALHDSLGELAPALRWRVALALRDDQEIRRIRSLLPGLDEPNLRMIGMTSQFDAEGVDDGERALRIRTRRAVVSDPIDALLAAHSLALNQGRPVLALDLTEQLQELKPGLRAHLRLRVLDALYGDGDTTAARQAAASLAQYANDRLTNSPDLRALQLADLCVLEQWRLAHGQTDKARHSAELLRATPIPRTPIPISANQLACAEILEAWWSVATHQPDGLRRVARLDSLMLSGPAVSDAGTYAHLVVSRLYTRLRQPAPALEAIRNRTYMVGWPRYLATARREEAHLATLVGQPEAAARSYRRYLALRSSAELPQKKRDEEIRSNVANLLVLRAEQK
jgi:DNA-binding SARP family transcriptional activator/TolB-like protein